MRPEARGQIAPRRFPFRRTSSAASSFVRFGLAAAVFVTLAAAERTAAQQGASDSRALKGRVIDAADVPIDQLGRPIVDGLPGFVPATEVPQAVRDEIAPLEKERDRIVHSAREARAEKDPSRLPSDAGAPAAMDSGNEDPDRLLPASQPPKPSFPEF